MNNSIVGQWIGIAIEGKNNGLVSFNINKESKNLIRMFLKEKEINGKHRTY
jgi:predicted transcriptional regulator with HTH domain